MVDLTFAIHRCESLILSYSVRVLSLTLIYLSCYTDLRLPILEI
jgi:hypothetical protein